VLCICFLVPLNTANATRHYFYSPQWIDNIEGHAFANPDSQPYHDVFMVLWGLGDDAVDVSVSWDVNDFSGFMPPSPLTQYQRGVEDVWGSTAVQLQGDSAGFELHSWSATGPPINDLRSGYYSYNFTTADNHRPWGYGATSSFRYSAFLQVPTGYYESSTCGYVQLVMHLTDTSTDTPLWVVVSAYDSRGSRGAIESVWWDEGTNTGTIISYFDSNRRYISLGAGSNSFTGTMWSGWRYFAYRVLPVHVSRWASDMNDAYGTNYSTDASNYRLNSFNVGPEMYTPSDRNARIGCSLRDVRLFTDY